MKKKDKLNYYLTIGMRLNEASHFHHYPPHNRKKMSLLRIIPRHLLSESKRKLDQSENAQKKFDKIVFNQQSEEIAVLTYNDNLKSGSSINSNKVRNKSQEIQTEIEFHQSGYSKISHHKTPLESEVSFRDETTSKHEISSDRKIASNHQISPSEISSKCKISSDRKISSNKIFSDYKIYSDCNVSSDYKVSTDYKISDYKIPQDKISSNYKIISDLEINPFGFHFSPDRESISKLKESSNKFASLNDNKNSNIYFDEDDLKKNSWWRNFFRQVIVDFFLQLLGKNLSKKQSREKFYSVATSTDENEHKNDKNDRKNGIKFKSKRIVNSYGDDDAQRRKRITYGKEDKLFFDLIQLTQDENLRAIILEQTMRMRILEEENARFRKKLTEKLKTRQSSSPFY